jgi:Zn-dependent M28 family amino/carboxypeptidase
MRNTLPLLVPALLLACSGGPADEKAAPEEAPDTAIDSGEPAPPASLEARMNLDRLLAHLAQLQDIGEAAADTRAAASDGHRASLDWVEATLIEAGLSPVRQAFDITRWDGLGPARLEVEGYGPFGEDDVGYFQGSPPGLASGPLVAVDLTLPAPDEEGLTSSGCTASDYTTFPAGAIALIQRGGCTFTEKAAAARDAGAVAVVIFNEGQPGRRDLFSGTLSPEVGIPVLSATYAVGEALAGGAPLATVESLTEITVAPTENLWVDLPGSGDGIVVTGAHLDSVTAGPGVNDNGSGTAVVLELALQSAARLAEGAPTPAHTQRFAFWGAEELGLLGSFHYVSALSEAELARHVANLNFDMVASPNGARFVYDGDASAGLQGYEPPDGSGEIEALFTEHFDARSLPYLPTAFDGRSDYGPFILAGIPAGGLFSGAEQEKSDSQAETFGGEARQPFDACYHEACDTDDNIDAQLLLEMAEAAAVATSASADWLPSARSAARRVKAPPSALPFHGGCDVGLAIR